MMSYKKHLRGSSGLQGAENNSEKPVVLPVLQRSPPEDPPAQQLGIGEDRWQDDGGESGEVVC